MFENIFVDLNNSSQASLDIYSLAMKWFFDSTREYFKCIFDCLLTQLSNIRMWNWVDRPITTIVIYDFRSWDWGVRVSSSMLSDDCSLNINDGDADWRVSDCPGPGPCSTESWGSEGRSQGSHEEGRQGRGRSKRRRRGWERQGAGGRQYVTWQCDPD